MSTRIRYVPFARETELDRLAIKQLIRPRPRPRLWPLVALALAGLLILLLALIWPVKSQAQGEDPENLCLQPRDAHTLVGQSIAMRSSLVACQGELEGLGELGDAPECSSACAELEALAGRIEAGVSWAILPDGTAERHPEGRYRFGTHRDWERLEVLRNRCREGMEAGCRYVPGLPSTGKTEVVMESEAGHE